MARLLAGRPAEASYPLTNRRSAPTNGGRSRPLCLCSSGHPAVPFGWRSGGVLPVSDQTQTDTFSRVVHLARRPSAVRQRAASRSLRCRKGKVLMLQARFVVIRETTEVVLRHLGRLPPSETTEQLCASVQNCMQEIEMRSVSSPTRRELDLLMKRVLSLHIEVTKLERRTLAPEADAPAPCTGSVA